MDTVIHDPVFTHINSHKAGKDYRAFHVIRMVDSVGRGELSMHIAGDWSNWDAITKAVAKYRGDTAQVCVWTLETDWQMDCISYTGVAVSQEVALKNLVAKAIDWELIPDDTPNDDRAEAIKALDFASKVATFSLSMLPVALS